MTFSRDTADHINEVAGIESSISTNTADIATNASLLSMGNNHGKNLIINGDFSVWQRGTNFTTVGYSADRWLFTTSGATGTVDQGTHTLGQTDVPGNPKHFLELDVTTANDNVGMLYRCEDVLKTANREVTLSFYAKGVNPGGGFLTLAYMQHFGTGGSPSPDVDTTISTSIALTASWQRFEFTFTPASITGKTLGTDGNDSFRLALTQGADTSTDAWNMDISNVQLEFGDTATDFEYVTPADQLARCLRYFERYSSSTDEVILGPATANDTTRFWIGVRYSTKRVIPTVTDSGAFEVLHLNGNVPGTISAVNDQGLTGCYLTFNRDSGTHIAGSSGIGRVDTGASNYLDIDAEL